MAAFNINWESIAKFIEELIKKKLVEKDLVKSGKLLKSINVISNGEGSFSVEAEDYFKYLDSSHDISKDVFNSQELANFIENEMAKQIQAQL